MSSLLVQFNNPNNWVQLYSQSLTVTPINGGNRYVPIPEAVLPILCEERILAAKATSADALSRWNTGGWLTPIVDTATSLGEARLRHYQIPLKYTGFIILPQFVQSYKLKLSIPDWLKSVHIDIWQYIGPIDDSTEKLIRDMAEQLNLNL